MDQVTALALIGAAAIGMVATLVILRHDRQAAETSVHESPFAASTEGEKRCPECGMGNLWTETTCSACGAELPGG